LPSRDKARTEAALEGLLVDKNLQNPASARAAAACRAAPTTSAAISGNEQRSSHAILASSDS
jgi:hypothetical protein